MRGGVSHLHADVFGAGLRLRCLEDSAPKNRSEEFVNYLAASPGQTPQLQAHHAFWSLIRATPSLSLSYKKYPPEGLRAGITLSQH